MNEIRLRRSGGTMKAGEGSISKIKEKLSQCHFAHHKSHTDVQVSLKYFSLYCCQLWPA